ncbi:MAG TPA: hypothetical protein IAB61_00960 [Candidatus Merdisoma merdipullorum]|nr:hypothetical protein [Candidatus Merdisoma merdipullorum]
MKLYYPITVDLYNIYPLPIMPAQQANIGRGAQVTLTANSVAVVPEDELVNIYVKKPDGTKVYADCTVSGNQIQVDFSQQMLMVPGMLEVELQMIDAEGNNITTPIFLLQNQRSNIDYAGITSSDEFTALVTALAEVEELKKNGLKGDAATVTVGTTTTGDPGTDAAVNNSGTTGDAVLNFTVPRGADGSMWYYGDDITGTSTSGVIFAGSGITAANVGDKYLNISTGDDRGNVYTCTVAGDAETAQWTYIGNIEGPQGPEGPAGTQEIIFAERAAFPETGQENMLYIDNTVNPALAYIWNGSDYIPAGGGEEITATDVTYSNTSSGLNANNVQGAIDESVEIIKLIKANQADAYNPEATYAAGDYCIYDNVLYKANQDISVAETWTPAHWTQTTVAAELSGLNSRTTFAEYSNVDLNMVNEYCFVAIEINPESYNAPSVGRYLCTPQAIGFQIGIDMNAGNFHARGHNWVGFSNWRSFSFS